MSPQLWLILVAAGVGHRLQRETPKALVPVGGRPILSWALDAFAPFAFARIVVAAPPDRVDDVARILEGRALSVPGGKTRSESVRRGFDALTPREGDIVLVHDAARPLIAAQEVEAVLRAAEQTGAAIAAVPLVDTIKKVEAGRILTTIDREGLFGAATPQAFRADLLRRALATRRETTDEAALCEGLGIPVAVVPVSRLSFKITTPEDLEVAEAILRSRGSGDAA